MSGSTTNTAAARGFRSAHTAATQSREIVEDLVAQFGEDCDPRLVLTFFHHDADGAKITGLLSERWPSAQVVGCTTAGEFTETHAGQGGTVALALSGEVITNAAAEIAGFRQGTSDGVDAAIARLESGLGSKLRDLSPSTHIGLLMVDGMHGDEELVNQRLGFHAPSLSFVGGSSGDGLEFTRTRVFCNGRESDHGAVFVVLEARVPFVILKTCSLRPGPHHFTVTRADVTQRVVHEVDGRPVLQAYAEAVGIPPEELDSQVFMRHPWGVMVGDDPWVRSPREVLPDGGLRFFCQIPEGMPLSVMENTDLIAGMRTALDGVRADLGGAAGGAVLFNCILRRLQMDADGLHQAWLELLADLPTAGFHTYGESWLGHMNQTCTGIVFAPVSEGTTPGA